MTPNTVTVCAICEMIPNDCNRHHGVRRDLVVNRDGSLITKEILESQYREHNRQRAEVCKRWKDPT